MADAVNSTTAPVIPFPSDRPRKPDPLGRQIDEWTRARCATNAAQLFGSTEAEAFDFMQALFLEGGANPIAHALEETAHAIQMMRGAIAELTAADQLIATAADRVLTEAGL